MKFFDQIKDGLPPVQVKLEEKNILLISIAVIVTAAFVILLKRRL